MDKDMKRVLELTEKYANDMEKIAAEMEEENEVLMEALREAKKINSSIFARNGFSGKHGA